MQVDKLLTDIELKITKIQQDTPRLQRSLSTFRQLEAVARRYLLLTGRLGLPSNIDSAIAKMAQFMVILRQLQITLIAVETAAGPLGWAMAGASIGITAVTTTDFMMGLGE